MFNYYVDGSYSAATEIGAYGFYIECDEEQKMVVSKAKKTTNNRMELCGLIAVLKDVKKRNRKEYAIVHCDSKYVIDGLQLWLPNWEKNNYKTAAGKPVKNVDLWKVLKALSKEVDFKLAWVKGHADTAQHNAIDAALAKVTKKGHS